MEDCKIRIESPEHSKAVQEWLFGLGVMWLTGGPEVEHTRAQCLFVRDNKLTYGSGEYLDQPPTLDTSFLMNNKQCDKVEITEDCYVDVEGWTEGEVLKAAEVFSNALGVPVGNNKVFDDFRYLHIAYIVGKNQVFVGDEIRLSESGATKELTKEQVLGSLGESPNNQPTPTYYSKHYKGVKLDPYRIAKIYNIDGGPREQILKKSLRGVSKGHEERQVIHEIRQALDRWEEMVDEDEGVQ